MTEIKFSMDSELYSKIIHLCEDYKLSVEDFLCRLVEYYVCTNKDETLAWLKSLRSYEKTPENTAIADMQVECIRKAQVKWNLSNAECAKLFKEYQLLEFIRKGYCWLSETSYDGVVIELEEYLKRKGVDLNIKNE